MQAFVKTMQLPCLLLDWSPSAEGAKDDSGRTYDWLCEYVLCLPVVSHDCRLSDDHEGATFLRVSMGKTMVTGGGGPDKGSQLETPYRDGAHIIRDGRTLRLPCYVRVGEKIAVLLDDHGYSFLPVPSLTTEIVTT